MVHKVHRSPNYWILVLSVSGIVLLAIYYSLKLNFISGWPELVPVLQKISMCGFLLIMVLLIGKITQRFIHKQVNSEGDKYNLLRIIRLLTAISIIFVTASFLFDNLYTTVLSLGLISLILGFALQAPITSFIAWLYIVFRRPYKVGHRIQINKMRGDVLEIGYLDTKILEISGDYVQNNRKTGRVIYFPNSLILKEQLINYSGPQTPFIWNETAIQIAYTSDLKFVESCLIKASLKDFEDRYPKRDVKIRKRWYPEVYFRVNTYAWLEAVISYPVEPNDTTGRRTRILTSALPMLNAEPTKVQFPEGSMR